MATNPLKSFVAHALEDAEPGPMPTLDAHRTPDGGLLFVAPAAERRQSPDESGAWIHADTDTLVDTRGAV